MINFFTFTEIRRLTIGLGSILILLGFLTLLSGKDGLSYTVRLSPQYVADFSNDRELMGASHNVFVGKIIAEAGNKESGIGPETQFEVEIIENIKGNLSDTILISQAGGYRDGTLYIVEDDIAGPSEDKDYLLQVGSIYLLATRYSEQQDWYTLNPHPAARKLISTDESSSVEDLRALAKETRRFNQLKAAYKDEILLEADIANNKIFNNYEDLQVDQPAQE